MKLKQLLDRISRLTHADRNEQMEQRSLLKNTLKQLRDKGQELEQRLCSEKDQALRKELQEKLNIIYAQRGKGLALLKELKDTDRKPGSDTSFF